MTLQAATQTVSTRPPRVGELVLVRSRRWLVDEVIEAKSPGQTCITRLSCADDDAQGQTIEVLWDYELDRLILEEEGWADLAAKGFDQPRQFAAFLHTLRWNCVTATDPNLFQAPFRAGIKIDAYQMEPLRKALRLPRVNLFIADDTGLGKTIEAGLIARELLLRKKAKTIVVATPPSVLEQWKAELEERFGLVFELLDRAYLTRMRRERGFGVNPWRTHSRFLVSHNLLIDPAYTDPLREWLGAVPAREPLDTRRGTPRGAGQRRTLWNRDQVHSRRARSRRPLRAPAIPFRDAAQRSLEQLLHTPRVARSLPIHSRRQGSRQKSARGRDGASLEGGYPICPGWLPHKERQTHCD